MVSLLEAPKPRPLDRVRLAHLSGARAATSAPDSSSLDHNDVSTTQIDTHVLNGGAPAVPGPAAWMFCRDGEQPS
jgi:hypothetical protein